MTEDTIVHIYCDGEECIVSIDGYAPHATDKFKKADLIQRGWTVVEEDDVVDGSFCGYPLVTKYGETYHFCPECSKKIRENDNERTNKQRS